jgi:hypothetical protein
VTSSPHYPQSNGLSEKAVGIAKSILKKCSEDGVDFRAALLEYRNTPISGMNVSPAEILMSRKLRTRLPLVSSQLKPKTHFIKSDLKKRQASQKKYYDRTAKQRPAFKPGDNVIIQNKRCWEPGLIMNKENTPRSYTILNSKGNEIRRNSVHIKKSLNEPIIVPEQSDTDIPGVNANEDTVRSEMPLTFNEDQGNLSANCDSGQRTTRSGRRVIRPNKFNDFVLH